MGFGAVGQFAVGDFIDAIAAHIIEPSGIATASAFGIPALHADGIVEPSGIASEETFGTLLVPITPVPIASGLAFGTASVREQISPSGISSAEAFGAPGLGEAATYLPVSKL